MRSPWLRAALALGIVSLSLLVSAIVFPDDRVMFSVLLLGVLVSAWYGGLLIGLTATVLAVIGSVAVPWAVLGRDEGHPSVTLPRLIVFAVVGAVVSAFADRRRRQQLQLQESAAPARPTRRSDALDRHRPLVQRSADPADVLGHPVQGALRASARRGSDAGPVPRTRAPRRPRARAVGKRTGRVQPHELRCGLPRRAAGRAATLVEGAGTRILRSGRSSDAVRRHHGGHHAAEGGRTDACRMRTG